MKRHFLFPVLQASKLPPYPYHRENISLPVASEKCFEAASNRPVNAAKNSNPQSNSDYINNNRPFSYTPDDPKLMMRPTLHPPQPPVKNKMASSIPRAGGGLHSPAPEPDYLECLEPADNGPRPLPTASREVPQIPKQKHNDHESETQPDVRRRAPAIPRISSDRSQFRVQPSSADVRR
jgi:hypothetical protein